MEKDSTTVFCDIKMDSCSHKISSFQLNQNQNWDLFLDMSRFPFYITRAPCGQKCSHSWSHIHPPAAPGATTHEMFKRMGLFIGCTILELLQKTTKTVGIPCRQLIIFVDCSTPSCGYRNFLPSAVSVATSNSQVWWFGGCAISKIIFRWE